MIPIEARIDHTPVEIEERRADDRQRHGLQLVSPGRPARFIPRLQAGARLPLATGLGIDTRAIENPWRAFLMAFDREEPGFRRDAALRGETADPAAGRDHPMARHDDRKRVSRESLPNRASRARGAGPCREGAVGHCRAPRNATRGLVDAAVEWRYEVHVEQNG